ncbi:MAG: hypothetical protein HY735_28500 [Verrucomicrobia bacterium]|nr:hypothetical protein [Verrucomicrobiota bacterium]
MPRKAFSTSDQQELGREYGCVEHQPQHEQLCRLLWIYLKVSALTEHYRHWCRKEGLENDDKAAKH